MNKSRLLMLILVSMIGCHVYSSDALAQSVRVPFTTIDGERDSIRLKQGDSVTITYVSGRRAPLDVTGKIKEIALQRGKFIKLETADGDQLVFLDSIRDIHRSDEVAPPAKDDPAPKVDDEVEPKPDDAAPEMVVMESKQDESKSTPVDLSKKGMFVLRLTGMVGEEFRPEEIENIVAQADERGPGQVIVLEINSGGGSVAEGMKIRDVILDACNRHRMVAWIETAVSCASWTALCCDEIVFKNGGFTGGITIMNGRTTAPEATVVWWIGELQQLLRKKNRPVEWAVPFVLEDSYLSSTKDPETGSIQWFNDPEQSGEYSHSKPGENLYFNYRTGVDWNLAVGVAQNEEELAELLKIGEWEPAGTGRKLNSDILDAKERLRSEAQELQYELQNAGNDISGINKRIKIYKRFLVIMRQYPNIAANSLGMNPKYAKSRIEDMIEELEWQKRQMR